MNPPAPVTQTTLPDSDGIMLTFMVGIVMIEGFENEAFDKPNKLEEIWNGGQVYIEFEKPN